jgi:hypothetical protein
MAPKHTPERSSQAPRGRAACLSSSRAKEQCSPRVAPREVSAGTTVCWEEGELHETRTETGLTALG